MIQNTSNDSPGHARDTTLIALPTTDIPLYKREAADAEAVQPHGSRIILLHAESKYRTRFVHKGVGTPANVIYRVWLAMPTHASWQHLETGCQQSLRVGLFTTGNNPECHRPLILYQVLVLDRVLRFQI